LFSPFVFDICEGGVDACYPFSVYETSGSMQ